MQRYRAIAQPDSERALIPAEAADVRVALFLPHAELRRRVRVPKLHLAVHRPRSDDVRLARRPLDADQPPSLSLRQLEQVRDLAGLKVLIVHIEATRDSDRVPRGPRYGVGEEVRWDAGPVQRKDELFPRPEMGLCRR